MMKIPLSLCVPVFCIAGMYGQDDFLKSFQWKHRLVLAFQTDGMQANKEVQLEVFRKHLEGFRDRDLLLFFIEKDAVTDVDGQRFGDRSVVRALREKLDVDDSAFTVLLIGKDGTEKLRSDHVLGAGKLFAVIDRMPMRRAEMRRKANQREKE